jgi:hypothetical protein
MSDDPEEQTQTFDDFKKMMESSFPTSTTDIIADKYDEIVSKSVQLLANLEPTGIVSTINQLVTENKAKREQENILYAIYWCRKSILKHQDILRNLEKEYLEQQGPELMNLYFEHCKNTYNRKKIEFFRNVWINGMIKENRDLDEKAYAFDLLASLRIEQVLVLKLIYESLLSEMRVNDIASTLNIDLIKTKHICSSLEGLGLLVPKNATFGSLSSGEPEYFGITDYIKIVVGYLVEPTG